MNKKDVQDALDAAKFKTWLETRGSQAPMVANHINSCPLACYLKDVTQARDIDVFGSYIRVGTLGFYTDDSWLEMFVRIIDDEQGSAQPPISQEQALEALRLAVKEIHQED